MILASDGLWDVMTSEEAVDFVHSIMGGALGASGEGGEGLASNEAGSGDGSGESAVAAVVCIVYGYSQERTRLSTFGSTAGNVWAPHKKTISF